jgi:hypothetical protein
VVSPEFATCGRDFYGMIEHYSFSRSIPMIFQGSGDCAAIDWTLLGGSIANWSFVCFVLHRGCCCWRPILGARGNGKRLVRANASNMPPHRGLPAQRPRCARAGEGRPASPGSR